MARVWTLAFPVAGLMMMGTATARAVVLANDTFDLPTIGTATVGDDAGDPLDIAFVGGGSSTNGVISLIDDPADTTAGLGSGNALALTTGAADQFAIGTFDTFELVDPGDWITVSGSFRINDTVSTQASGLRFGFGRDSKVYGFSVSTGNSTTAIKIERFGGGLPDGGSLSLTVRGDPSVIIKDTDAHTFSFTLTKVGANAMDFSLTIDNSSYTASAASSTSNIFDFNRLVLGVGDTAFDMRYDNIKITTIPEPASLVLIGMGGLMIMPLRRRRQR